ncbi:hypothetical protein GCM10027405_24370 [Arthrobacter alkaliphilus]
MDNVAPLPIPLSNWAAASNRTVRRWIAADSTVVGEDNAISRAYPHRGRQPRALL